MKARFLLFAPEAIGATNKLCRIVKRIEGEREFNGTRCLYQLSIRPRQKAQGVRFADVTGSLSSLE
jgi:hypothetical protein